MMLPKLTRREFCLSSIEVLSAGAAIAALTGCGGSPTSPGSGSGSGNFAALPTISAAVVNNTVTLNVDSPSPLAAVGGAALVNASGRAFLVARTAQSAFTALTAVCTHEACTVSAYQNQVYECQCHGSQFSVSGSVVRGPALRPLSQFTTSLSGNALTINV